MTESVGNETIETRHKKLGYVSYVYAIILIFFKIIYQSVVKLV
jgi:hypothetical protein